MNTGAVVAVVVVLGVGVVVVVVFERDFVCLT